MRILSAVQQSMHNYDKSHQHHRQKRAEKSVCYGELGCFEDSGPFGYLDMLPQSPEEIGTKFFFYSTENRSDRPLLEIPYLNMSRMFYELNPDEKQEYNATDSFAADNSTVLTPEIQKNIQKLKSFEGFDRMSIRVIVHGFGAACHHVWIYEMRTALMAVVSYGTEIFSCIFYLNYFLLWITGRLHCYLCWLGSRCKFTKLCARCGQYTFSW